MLRCHVRSVMSFGGHLNGLHPKAALAQITATNSARGNAVFFIDLWGCEGGVENERERTEWEEGIRTLLHA